MANLTNSGYVLKPQNDWFAEERQLYLNIDPLWNLDPSTPDGLKIAHDAEVFYVLDETLQRAYNSKDPNKAKGRDLDVLSALTGTVRSKGTASTVELFLSGAAGSFVPKGTRYSSSTTGSIWATSQDVTLDSFGSVSVIALCTVSGPTQADSATIIRMVDVVGGVASCINPDPATPGTNAQTDSQLRVTRATAVGKPGNNQVDSTIGELFAVDGVRRVKAYENDTSSSAVSPENPYGLPAHSMSYIVDGGSVDDVAMAIYLKKNPGVYLNQAGTPVSAVVTSPSYPTNSKLIKFSVPVYVDIEVVIEVADDGTLPSDAGQKITSAILEFTSGDLIPADVGFKIDGFDIGESIPYTTMFTPINQVIGQYGNSYISSMTLNGASANVQIEFNEMSRWTSANIMVSIV